MCEGTFALLDSSIKLKLDHTRSASSISGENQGPAVNSLATTHGTGVMTRNQLHRGFASLHSATVLFVSPCAALHRGNLEPNTVKSSRLIVQLDGIQFTIFLYFQGAVPLLCTLLQQGREGYRYRYTPQSRQGWILLHSASGMLSLYSHRRHEVAVSRV